MTVAGGKTMVEFDKTKLNHTIKSLSSKHQTAATFRKGSQINLAIADNVNAASSQTFGYDLSNRLTTANGGYGAITYSYDANGNRTMSTDTVGNVFDVNAPNVTRVKSGTKNYTYSANQRLIAVSDAAGAQIAGYLHNGKGERVSKTANGLTTWYVYDSSGNLIAEIDGATGAVNKEYIYGVSGRLVTIEGNNVLYHHNDHLGTPQALTNNAGSIVWSIDQSPFGITSVNEDIDGDGVNVTNNFRFPGQYYDGETGLNYNYFRTYDSFTGRYTQHDPIGLQGGINSYGYVNASPLIGIDIYGLQVTVIIRRQTRSSLSIMGTINVSSDEIRDSFSGYTLEPIRDKGVVPAGSYDAFLRTDHTPRRIELRNVPGNTNIQIHNGNLPSDSEGCFLVGERKGQDRVIKSIDALNSILAIIDKDFEKDCSEKITVRVIGL